MDRRETRPKRADGAFVTHRPRAERVWNPRKQRSDVRMRYHCGRADAPQSAERLRQLARSILTRCAPEEMVEPAPPWRVLEAWPFGALDVLEAIWPRLGIDAVIAPHLASPQVDVAVERALCARVANRACAPSAKLYGAEPWRRADVRLDGTETLALPHLSRAMDVREAHQEAIEQALYVRLAALLSLAVELMFYDTTFLPCELDAIDWGVGAEDCVEGRLAAGAKTDQAPRPRGRSKTGRGDAPPIGVGLAVTRDGWPVRHWVFPGHTVDVTTVAPVKADRRGWQRRRWVVVGAAGMVSPEKLTELSASGGQYLLCLPRRRGDEVTRAVVQRPGRYQRVADHLRVKDVVVGDGERRRRSSVCHNPQEETRQRAHRQALRRELEAALASLHEVRGAGQSKRVCELRASRRYGRDLRLTTGGLLKIDAAMPREDERLDGQFVVHSHDDRRTPADLAWGDTPRQRVEEAWRTRNNGRRLRPVLPWAVHRLHAHVALRGLAWFVERVIEPACGETWRHIRADLEPMKLAPLSRPHGESWQVTEPSSHAANRLTCLAIKNPPAVFHLA